MHHYALHGHHFDPTTGDTFNWTGQSVISISSTARYNYILGSDKCSPVY